MIAIRYKYVSIWDTNAQERLIRFPISARSRLALGGSDGRELFALEAERLTRLAWSPRSLGVLACARFGNVAWEAGVRRILGDDAGSPCAASPNR